MLNRRRRNQRLIVEGLDQQARVHKLVGIEHALGVVEGGAQLDGTGGGVDLVVDGAELAGASRCCWVRS